MNVAAYGYKKCSLKHKIQPQEKFCNHYPPCQEVWAWAGTGPGWILWKLIETRLPCTGCFRRMICPATATTAVEKGVF